MNGCTCYVTDPKTWTIYGSAVEPGQCGSLTRTAQNISPPSNATSGTYWLRASIREYRTATHGPPHE